MVFLYKEKLQTYFPKTVQPKPFQSYREESLSNDWSVTQNALILRLVGTVVALLGLAVLITYSVKNGIILLVIAFLLSPVGLPMLAVRVLGVVQDINYALQDFIQCR